MSVRNGGKGLCRVISTRVGSTALADLKYGSMDTFAVLLPFLFSHRSKFHATAAASTGVPSVNFTPSLRVKVYVLPSGETVHVVASHGRMLPSSARVTSPS